MLKPRFATAETTLVRVWIWAALAVAAALVLAPAARADTSQSINWAGYAVHRAGVSFHQVSASWTQPTASCTRGEETFSAYWVGLGGFSEKSNSLEQIGTEADCGIGGVPILSAWYEVIPAGPRTIGITVRAGDRISASVTVVGHQLTLSLTDASRHRGFSRTLRAPAVDVSSAEWIVEAPLGCAVTIASCQNLPLANFGAAMFRAARAVGSKGHSGSISSPRWRATRINMSPRGRQPADYGGYGMAVGLADPSPLQVGGSAFTVTFTPMAVPGYLARAPRSAAAAPGRRFH